MALMCPDPTFYRSPGMAMKAPPERPAYVALLNVDKTEKKMPWASSTWDPNSAEHGRLVGQAAFPHEDNELREPSAYPNKSIARWGRWSSERPVCTRPTRSSKRKHSG
jgi:hypothetical protein